MSGELIALTSADWNGGLRTRQSIFWTDWRRRLKSHSRSFSRNPLKAPLLLSRCHGVVRSHRRSALSHNSAHNPLGVPMGRSIRSGLSGTNYG
jgi:hypothetical protein